MRRTALRRKTPLKSRRRAWPKKLKRRILDRDGGMCQWPGCPRPANDPAHILNRSHKSIIWDEVNVFSACRRHHNMGATKEARPLLLALMFLRHKCDYTGDAYSDYWGVACELLELANYDEQELIRTWRARHHFVAGSVVTLYGLPPNE